MFMTLSIIEIKQWHAARALRFSQPGSQRVRLLPSAGAEGRGEWWGRACSSPSRHAEGTECCPEGEGAVISADLRKFRQDCREI